MDALTSKLDALSPGCCHSAGWVQRLLVLQETEGFTPHLGAGELPDGQFGPNIMQQANWHTLSNAQCAQLPLLPRGWPGRGTSLKHKANLSSVSTCRTVMLLFGTASMQ